MSIGTERLKLHTKKLVEEREADTRAFRSFLRGKRVIFVGPAPTLVGTGAGAFIDGYDVIIRSGGFPPVKKELSEDYGSGTDVWYANSVFLNNLDKGRVRACLEQGLQWACVKGVLAGERFFASAPVNLRIYSSNVPGVSRPTLGVCIAHEVAQCEVRRFMMVGVTFFSGGLKGSHLPGYLTDELERTERVACENGGSGLEKMGHDYHNGDLYIKSLCESGKLFLDNASGAHLDIALERNKGYVRAC